MSNWETGRSEPDYDALIEMSQIFGTSIDYILGNSDIKKAPSLEDAGLSAEEAELLKVQIKRLAFGGDAAGFQRLNDLGHGEPVLLVGLFVKNLGKIQQFQFLICAFCHETGPPG